MMYLISRSNTKSRTLVILALISVLTVSFFGFARSVSAADDTATSLQASLQPLINTEQNAYKQWQQEYWAKQGISLPGDTYVQQHSGASLKTKLTLANAPGSGPEAGW